MRHSVRATELSRLLPVGIGATFNSYTIKKGIKTNTAGKIFCDLLLTTSDYNIICQSIKAKFYFLTVHQAFAFNSIRYGSFYVDKCL